MSTKNISDDEFEAAIAATDKHVLVDFWAEWCGPCKQLGPILNEVAGELSDKVTVVKVNIEENPEAPQRYGVRGVPTMILFKDGKAVATKVGSIPKSQLVEWINNNVA